jgi:putative ATP-dependent endonuclease of OLD family
MYLSHLKILNFRKLHALELEFNQGLNLLVGENDSGKSSIIDAIKFVTGTQSNDWNRITNEDFYFDGTNRSTDLRIECTFSALDENETAAFLEWASVKEKTFYLKLTLIAKRKILDNAIAEVSVDIRAGEGEESGMLNGEAKNKLKATYLKALRDAEYELAPRKGSRLSQILGAYEIFQQKTGIEHELVGVMNKANSDIGDYFDTGEGKIVSQTINETYLKQISLTNNKVTSKFGIAKNDLGRILEKLELQGISNANESNLGLGSNNLLFIATEMLLLQKSISYVGLKLSLIEEIEAHIHPQAQINLIDFLDKHSASMGFQNIVSTHSNSIASKVNLNNVIICKEGKAFPLKHTLTKLDAGDYQFLERFLDDTKANLFFACGVIIVEGDAENLLLPAFAEYINLPLHKYGISIVNVGSTALLRYSRIFQRSDGQKTGITVACITDRDIPPKEAGEYTYEVKRRKTGLVEQESLLSDSRKTEDQYTQQELQDIRAKKITAYQGGDVEVFVSNIWTLEYEIALSCLKHLLYRAILISRHIKNNTAIFDLQDYKKIYAKSNTDFKQWKDAGKSDIEIAVDIYSPLEREIVSKAVVAQIFSKLLLRSKIKSATILADPNLQYLVNAIKHAANV